MEQEILKKIFRARGNKRNNMLRFIQVLKAGQVFRNADISTLLGMSYQNADELVKRMARFGCVEDVTIVVPEKPPDWDLWGKRSKSNWYRDRGIYTYGSRISKMYRYIGPGPAIEQYVKKRRTEILKHVDQLYSELNELEKIKYGSGARGGQQS